MSAYARSLAVWGRPGKFDVVLPYAWIWGTALLAGQPRERNVAGFGDLRVRFSVNFYGAPALSLQEFAPLSAGPYPRSQRAGVGRLLGATLALPVNRQNPIKLYASTGISIRTGSEFDAVGIAWQYRWGGGL
ncbi:MAG TPA: hypothetical protein VLA73_05330 [Burkholderiales bacterium]|nr:hypothetical protein [Burkholderiales bacterium]